MPLVPKSLVEEFDSAVRADRAKSLVDSVATWTDPFAPIEEPEPAPPVEPVTPEFGGMGTSIARPMEPEQEIDALFAPIYERLNGRRRQLGLSELFTRPEAQDPGLTFRQPDPAMQDATALAVVMPGAQPNAPREQKLAAVGALGTQLRGDPEFGRILTSIAAVEGGLDGAVGDKAGGGSFGPYQFYAQGQLPNFASWLVGKGMAAAGNALETAKALANDLVLATTFAAETYLGAAYQKGRELGLRGADLATHVQRTGQVSVSPERAGMAYQQLFGGTDPGTGFIPTTVELSEGPVAPRSGPGYAAMPEGQGLSAQGLTPPQFGLNDPDAESICGIVLLMAFQLANGRNPTLQESKAVAATYGGWTSVQGMGGPYKTAEALRALGVPAHAEAYTRDEDIPKMVKEIADGDPVGVNTGGHYYVAEAYDPSTGRFDFGQSVLALKASKGRRWFTVEELAGLGMGAADVILYKDSPRSGKPSIAVQETGMPTVSNAANGVMHRTAPEPELPPGLMGPGDGGYAPQSDQVIKLGSGDGFEAPMLASWEGENEPVSAPIDVPSISRTVYEGEQEPVSAPIAPPASTAPIAAQQPESGPMSPLGAPDIVVAPPGVSDAGFPPLPPIAEPEYDRGPVRQAVEWVQSVVWPMAPEGGYTDPLLHGTPDVAPGGQLWQPRPPSRMATPSEREASRVWQEGAGAQEGPLTEPARPITEGIGAVAQESAGRSGAALREGYERGGALGATMAAPMAIAEAADPLLPEPLRRDQFGVELPVVGRVGVADVVGPAAIGGFVGVGMRGAIGAGSRSSAAIGGVASDVASRAYDALPEAVRGFVGELPELSRSALDRTGDFLQRMRIPTAPAPIGSSIVPGDPSDVRRIGLGVPEAGYGAGSPEAVVERLIDDAPTSARTGQPNPVLTGDVPGLRGQTAPVDMDDLRLAYEVGIPYQGWYSEMGDYLRRTVGDHNLNEVAQIFGVTSPNALVKDNMAAALSIFRAVREVDAAGRLDLDEVARAVEGADKPLKAIKETETFKLVNAIKAQDHVYATGDAVAKTLWGYATGEMPTPSNAKISTYASNILDAAVPRYATGGTMDLWMARAEGLYDMAARKAAQGSDIWYRTTQAITNRIAREYGVQQHQAQAGIWYTLREMFNEFATSGTQRGQPPDPGSIAGRLERGEISLGQAIELADNEGLWAQRVPDPMEEVLDYAKFRDVEERLLDSGLAQRPGPGRASEMGLAFPGEGGKPLEPGGPMVPPRPVTPSAMAERAAAAEAQAPMVRVGSLDLARQAGLEPGGKFEGTFTPNVLEQVGDELYVSLPGGNIDTARWVAGKIMDAVGVDSVPIHVPHPRGDRLGGLVLNMNGRGLVPQIAEEVEGALRAAGLGSSRLRDGTLRVANTLDDEDAFLDTVERALAGQPVQANHYQGAVHAFERSEAARTAEALEQRFSPRGPSGLFERALGRLRDVAADAFDRADYSAFVGGGLGDPAAYAAGRAAAGAAAGAHGALEEGEDPPEVFAAALVGAARGALARNPTPVIKAVAKGVVEAEHKAPSAWDWVQAVRFGGMLSGLPNFTLQAVGGATELVLQVAEDSLRAVGRQDPSAVGRPIMESVGSFAALKDAMVAAAKVTVGATAAPSGSGAMLGRNASLSQRYAARGESGRAAVASAIETPARFITQAPDAFWSVFGDRYGRARMAAEIATNEGATGAQWATRYADLLDGRAAEADLIDEAGTDMAERLTFRGELGGVSGAIHEVLADDRISKGTTWFIPFFRTLAKIIETGLERVPFVPTSSATALKGEQASRQLVGAVLGLHMVDQAFKGNITGPGDPDPGRNELERANGRENNAFRVGPFWLPHAAGASLAPMLGVIGAYVDTQRYESRGMQEAAAEQDAERYRDQKAALMIGNFGRAFRDFPLAQGARDFSLIWTDPTRGLSELIGGTAASFVPAGGLVRNMAMSVDPYQRRPERGAPFEQQLGDQFAAVSGIGRRELPAAQDPLGRPVANPRQGAAAFLPRASTQRPSDPILQAFLDARVPIGDPPRTIGAMEGTELRLTPEEQRAWDTYRGETLARLWRPELQNAASLEVIKRRASEAATARILRDIGAAGIRSRSRRRQP